MCSRSRKQRRTSHMSVERSLRVVLSFNFFLQILSRDLLSERFAMWWTPIRCSRIGKSSGLARSIQNLLPNKLPPSLSARPGNLYQVISRAPGGGVGKKVHQLRWSEKQISDSYWVVTRAMFKCEGRHGKAWGKLYWKGRLLPICRLLGSHTMCQPSQTNSSAPRRSGYEVH